MRGSRSFGAAAVGFAWLTAGAVATAACPPVVHWSTDYNGPTNGYDIVSAAAVTPTDDSIVVGGYVTGFGTYQDWLIRKYLSTGTLAWQASFVGSQTDWLRALDVDASGNVIAVGMQDLLLPQLTNWMVRMYDPDGSLLWTDTFDTPGGEEWANAVAFDPAGDAVVAGYTSPGFDSRWLIRKYGPGGALLWSTDYVGPVGSGAGAAIGVAADSFGTVYVVGRRLAPAPPGYLYSEWVVRVYAPSGEFLRMIVEPSSTIHGSMPTAIALTAQGNLVLVGNESRADIGEAGNLWVQMRDPYGVVLWTRSFNGGPDVTDAARAVAVDAAGDIYVTGVTGSDWLLHKYDPAGALIWAADRQPGDPYYGGGFGVGVDSAGRVVTAGGEPRNDIGQSLNWRIRRYLQPVGCLAADLTVSASPAPVGDWITVRLSVTNPGTGLLTSVVPDLRLVSGGLLLNYQDGPVPSGPVSLGPGEASAFTWTYSVSGGGLVTLSATVTGQDPSLGGFPISASFSVPLYTTYVRLASSLSVTPAQTLPGNLVTIVMTVTNAGSVDAADVTPACSAVAGGGLVSLVTGPAPAMQTISAGATRHFTWTWSATGAGTVEFSATATGSDAATFAPVSAAAWVSLVVTAPPPPPDSVGAATEEAEDLVKVTPNPVHPWDRGGRLTVHARGAVEDVEADVFNAAMERIFSGRWIPMGPSPWRLELPGVVGWAPGVYAVRVRVKPPGGGPVRNLPVVKLVVRE